MGKAKKAILILGSNVGKRKYRLRKAIENIGLTAGRVLSCSHVYETEPWGDPDQPWYLNQVLVIETTLEPDSLLAALHQIEKSMGRKRSKLWEPRIIDIDILFYEQLTIREKHLVIPHPQIEKRNFVLVPLMEIAAGFIHPVLEKTVEELYVLSEDTLEVIRLENKSDHNCQ